jgi:hypothetical protein
MSQRSSTVCSGGEIGCRSAARHRCAALANRTARSGCPAAEHRCMERAVVIVAAL